MFSKLNRSFVKSQIFHAPLFSISPIHSTRVVNGGDHVWKKNQQPCMAIRRETINAWERRAPLAPKHVKQLTKAGVKVLVQPSNRRAYTLQDYINAGAVAQEDISEASLIVSVKSVPIDQLQPDKTYVFFSHTIKAQKNNMPMLDAILQRNIRLIDYEKMVDAKGQRVVAFGKWAGYAGTINILHATGLRLLALGHNTPFLHIGLAHNYRDSHMAQNAIREAGYEIALGLMPRSLGPLTFVFTGSGNVSQGAQEIFQCLPHEYVDVSHLPKVSQYGSLDKVYGCVVSRDDHFIRKDGGGFDQEEYDSHPELYTSNFSTHIAPYSSIIINGLYWAPNSPRLLSIPDAQTLLTPVAKHSNEIPGCPVLPHRLLSICDISADPGGSIEFMTECTTIDHPFCIYDAEQRKSHDAFDLPTGVVVCSIHNMPAQMPLEATEYFGNLLLPFVFEMLESDAASPFEDFDASPTVKNAVIASNSTLTPNFEYISELRRKNQYDSAHKVGRSSISERRKVLVLGAGFVSAPVVDYLCRRNDADVTVGTALQEDIEKLLLVSPLVRPEIIDVQNQRDKLENLINDNDLVISLLPSGLHTTIAKMCIKHKTNMVTASYSTKDMLHLHNEAQQAGVTIINEVGMSPGIDHLLAKQVIDIAHEQGGKVVSLLSWCGRLPSPEASENPLRFKFSWNPISVFSEILEGATYLAYGEKVHLNGGEDVLSKAVSADFLPGFNFEGIPCRDFTLYKPLYGLHHVEHLARYTLRYKGFAESMKALLTVGLLDSKPNELFDPSYGPDMCWKVLLATLMNLRPDIFVETLKDKVAEKVGGYKSQGFKTLDTLGLFSEDVIVDRQRTPLDTVCTYLTKKLKYDSYEQDMCVIHHDIRVLYPQGNEKVHHVNLVSYGNPKKFSAISSTVGYTTAIVAKMILDGEIQQKGVVLPLSKGIYRTVLKRLQKEGINGTTTTTTTFG